jgi:4-amino-4-deoxy-L-arabinose transferase-like glycosyltransferase
MGGRNAFLAILVVSTGLKLALLVPAHETYPVGDARDYLLAAQTLLDGHYDSSRPPLWPATLAAARWLAERRGEEAVTPLAEILPGQRTPPRPTVSDLDLARFLLVVFSAFTVWLVFRLGCELFDPRAGLFAAGLFAFAPSFVGYTHLLWAETQFAMLNVGWVLLLVRGVRSERVAWLAAAGAVLGLAALTRQLMLSFTAVVVVWLLFLQGREWRKALRPGAVFALAAGLTIAPWTLRNAVEYRAFVPIAPMGGFGLLHGISKDPHGELRRAGILEAMRQPGTTWVDRDRMIQEHALGVMTGDPAAFLRRAFTLNLPDLWRPGSRVLEYAREGEGTGPTRQHGYGGVSPGLGLGLIAVFVASYVLFAAAGILGAALAPRWRETLLPLAMVAQACAMHALIGANLRHRLYFMPFVLLYAGFAVSRRRSELRTLATPRRLVLATAGLTLFAVLFALSEPAELREQWAFFRVAARVGAP